MTSGVPTPPIAVLGLAVFAVTCNSQTCSTCTCRQSQQLPLRVERVHATCQADAVPIAHCIGQGDAGRHAGWPPLRTRAKTLRHWASGSVAHLSIYYTTPMLCARKAGRTPAAPAGQAHHKAASASMMQAGSDDATPSKPTEFYDGLVVSHHHMSHVT